MKIAEKKEARRLRKECGYSVCKIAAEVGVSKGTVSVWVRDIELSEGQKNALLQQNPACSCQMAGSAKIRELALEKRMEYQREGKEEAKNNSQLHLEGCMLYWAEGAKDKKSLRFAKSDPNMHRVFMRFLRECLGVPTEDITCRIQCYTDCHTADEIEQYWLKVLDLPISALRKTVVNHVSRSPGMRRRGLLEFRTCHVIIHSVRLAQRVLGAIQEYGGFIQDKWTW